MVGEAGGAEEAVREAAASQPDVVLLDLVMPAGDGVGAIRGLLDAVPGVRVVVLTSFADDAQIFAATAAGAAGYLLKDIDPEALAVAIRDVHDGASRPASVGRGSPDARGGALRTAAPRHDRRGSATCCG